MGYNFLVSNKSAYICQKYHVYNQKQRTVFFCYKLKEHELLISITGMNDTKVLIEKIKDAITIAHHYGYELPIAQEKKLSKKALNNQ